MKIAVEMYSGNFDSTEIGKADLRPSFNLRVTQEDAAFFIVMRSTR
jgi:hypothetical protein